MTRRSHSDRAPRWRRVRDQIVVRAKLPQDAYDVSPIEGRGECEESLGPDFGVQQGDDVQAGAVFHVDEPFCLISHIFTGCELRGLRPSLKGEEEETATYGVGISELLCHLP